jgi:hypothetical protein
MMKFITEVLPYLGYGCLIGICLAKTARTEKKVDILFQIVEKQKEIIEEVGGNANLANDKLRRIAELLVELRDFVNRKY